MGGSRERVDAGSCWRTQRLDATFTTLLIEGKRQLGPSDVPGKSEGGARVGPFETGKTWEDQRYSLKRKLGPSAHLERK